MSSPRPEPSEPRATAGTQRLGEDLADSFGLDAVTALAGPLAAAALHREQRVPALLAARRAGAEQRETAALTRLFLLGDDVTRHELDAALPRTGTAGALAAGLVRASGQGPHDAVRAQVDLRPYEVRDAAGAGRWWVASDLGELATGQGLPADHVLGVGGASTTLAQLTLRTARERTLDLGTGCGVQALHALRHSGTVVATDVSPRALAFARFNAALAGAELDLRAGSLFAPVAAETFDLVVSNPPFVITPRAAYRAGLPVMSYRDGSAQGDGLVRDLVTGVAEHLSPGGVAQLLGNWEHRDGEDWTDRVRGWLTTAGLDGWVVQRELQDPAEYAETWLRDGGMATAPGRYEEVYAAWLDDFVARGVTAIGFGYLTLRRPTQPDRPRWHRIEDAQGPARQPLGGHIALVLERQEWLATRSDTELAGVRHTVGADVTEERYLSPGAPDPRVLLLRQGEGLGRTYEPGTVLAAAVGACDGELRLGQIIAALASLLDVAETEVARDVLPGVRRLVLDGFLHPER